MKFLGVMRVVVLAVLASAWSGLYAQKVSQRREAAADLGPRVFKIYRTVSKEGSILAQLVNLKDTQWADEVGLRGVLAQSAPSYYPRESHWLYLPACKRFLTGLEWSSIEEFLSQQVPTPSLEERQKLIKAYDSYMSKAQQENYFGRTEVLGALKDGSSRRGGEDLRWVLTYDEWKGLNSGFEENKLRNLDEAIRAAARNL